METRWDVIVIGCGAVGSAALYQLARRGVKALGIDRFGPPHDRGSSHGETRITRLALGEGEQYVQFARRSHEIWQELEAITGRTLLRQVGGLVYGRETERRRAHGAADFLRTTIDVAQRHGIRHEVLAANEMADRFPQFRFCGDEIGYFEYEAGFVHPEMCITALIEAATRLTATIHQDEKVVEWRSDENTICVTTTRAQYQCSRLLLCAGPWLPALAPALATHARVYRQVLFWFEPDGPREMFAPERMPVFIRVPDTDIPCSTAFQRCIAGMAG